jgi:serine/threonine-protein kinase
MTLEARGYRVLGTIARGGMAEIVLAERAAAGVSKRFALKRLLPALAKDPDFVRMFRNEAGIAAQLQNANIVTVFEFGEAGGQLFLAMDYIRGWELANILGACSRAKTTMPVEIALHIAHEVSKALAYAHEKRGQDGRPLGIVHRDVSPANVLVSTDGEIKLTDFGIARAASAGKTTSGWLKGKVPYMSPEQARAEPLDARSDLFSLGILLFEMLTARRLFPGEPGPALLDAVRSPQIPSLSSVRAVPVDVEAIVATALKAEPSKRFQTARQMQTALAAAERRLAEHVSADDVKRFLGSLDLPPPPEPQAISRSGPTAPAISRVVPPKATPAPAPSSAPASARLPPATGSQTLALAAMLLVPFVLAMLVARWAARPRAHVRLEVRSDPAATVWIDGELRGAPPVVIFDLPARAVEVRVARPSGDGGAMDFRKTVDLSASPDLVLDVPFGMH